MKRIISTILTLVLVISLFSVDVSAANINTWFGAANYSNYYKTNGKEPVLYPGSIVEDEYVPVGTTEHGDWLEYEVELERTMDYAIEIGYSNAYTETEIQPKVNIYLDGVQVVENGHLEITSTWGHYVTASFGPVDVTVGKHTLRVEFVDNGFSFAKYRFYNKDYIDPSVGYRANFTDIQGHWAEYDITRLTSKGIINGVSANRFAPEDTLTLYQAVWLVSRCVGVDCEATNPSWKNVAEQYGLMESTRADVVITREEFAHVVMQGYKHAKGDAIMAGLTFPDSASISLKFKTSVAQTVGAGFIKGDEKGYFNPKANLTRAEAATIISRLLKAI